VYTTGKGASAVGLTASVRNDPLTREWTLEGGALVLADTGICLIDEFDKMSDQDRTSIHEAMEQQSISISKAGIICTLKARCAVVAAANPVLGRYDSTATFMDNVDLTEAILSRFDILCVIRDLVDRDVDNKLASFVIDSHRQSHPGYDEEKDGKIETFELQDPEMTMPQDLLRKYILYARHNCSPRISGINADKIGALYAELRRESSQTDGIPIAVRHMESMIRMAESHAKMHLRDYVTEEDINMAMRVMLEAFIGTQKFAVRRTLEKHFAKYISYHKDSHELLLHVLKSLVSETEQYHMLHGRNDVNNDELVVTMDDFRARVGQLDITRLDSFFQSPLFRRNGFILNRETGQIIKQY
jgi:DNA replication licensing factor MCM2